MEAEIQVVGSSGSGAGCSPIVYYCSLLIFVLFGDEGVLCGGVYLLPNHVITSFPGFV
jgi:hypothetical protein